ncbi:unnamed protein product [Effrenium voratum]|uniref:Uncharacterized protein n=1 Tax=Effrenium voratum TaxID=2562239 RepID=A0AA36NBZ1_9DINO|nr:unnamed protein product [Effrenium voratum]
MLQPQCNGWRQLRDDHLPNQVSEAYSARPCGFYQPERHEGTRCWQQEAQAMHLRYPTGTPHWQAGADAGWNNRFGGTMDSWDQNCQRCEVQPSHCWSSACKCRTSNYGTGRPGQTFRQGSRADSKSQTAAARLKALELEHQELRRQLQLLPQREKKSQDCRCEGSCGSRCAATTKSRSRSACGAGPQSQNGRSFATHRDRTAGREVLQEKSTANAGHANGAGRKVVPTFASETPLDQRTQNNLQDGQCVYNGFSQQDMYDLPQQVGQLYQEHQDVEYQYQDNSSFVPSPSPMMPDLRQMPRAVCPTPYALGSVCGRGERELPGWRSCQDSNEILGTCAEIINSTARYIYDVLKSRDVNQRGPLKILSAADGCADDTLQEAQARYVPTSVMLAHAFAACTGGWSDWGTKIRVYGGDVRNPIMPFWQPQALPWQLPMFLEHRFLSLDNTKDFAPQLYNGQCEAGQLFDAVLLRQGLCFCDDPSKISGSWPLEVSLSCKSCINCRTSLHLDGQQEQTPVRMTAICGVYRLEPFLCENRAAYRLGRCVLRWCPDRLEWAILDDADGGAWAYARGDLGHPTLSRGPWTVWDGHNHVSDASFACNLVQPTASPPWHLMPQQRMVCAGVTGDAESVIRLLCRVAAILDTTKPDSFGLLHGAWTNGTQVEVEQLHRQLTDAVQIYNDRRAASGGFPLHAACLLWRTAATQYWLQCASSSDGIMLFQPGSYADPYRTYGSIALV